MRTKIYSLSLLLACCITAMAIVPQKRAAVKSLRSEQSIMLPNIKAATAITPLSKTEEGVIYVEDFEDAENTWTLIQTPGAGEKAYGIYVAENPKSNLGSIPAASGTMYLVADYDPDEAVNVWAISKSVELTAGTTYWVSAFFIATDAYGNDDFTITMGTSNTTAAQTTVLIDNSGANFQAYDEWTLLKKTFTVPTTGTYYFGFNHNVPKDQFFAAMDLFRITTVEPQIPAPKITGNTMALHNGAWSATADVATLYLPTDSAELAINVDATFATEYDWTITGAQAAYEDSTNVMLVTFPETVDAIVSVKAASTQGDTTAVWLYKGFVKAPAGTTDLLMNFNPDEVANSIGFNVSKKYKMSYAEGYNHLDQNEEASISAFNIGVYESYFEDYADSIITFRVLGSKAGEGAGGEPILIPDDTKELGRKTMTYTEFLGTGTYVEAPGKFINVTFDKPVNVTGQYFITIDLVQPDTLTCSLENNYIQLYCLDRGNGNALPTSYWRPYSVYLSWNDEDAWTSEGEYYRLLYYQAFGVDYTIARSLAIYPVVTYGPYVGVNNVKANNTLSIYPTPAKDMLYVENMDANATVAIMDVMGRTVANYNAASVAAGINVKDLSAGIYVISVRDAAGTHTSKFVKE